MLSLPHLSFRFNSEIIITFRKYTGLVWSWCEWFSTILYRSWYCSDLFNCYNEFVAIRIFGIPWFLLREAILIMFVVLCRFLSFVSSRGWCARHIVSCLFLNFLIALTIKVSIVSTVSFINKFWISHSESPKVHKTAYQP